MLVTSIQIMSAIYLQKIRVNLLQEVTYVYRQRKRAGPILSNSEQSLYLSWPCKFFFLQAIIYNLGYILA